MRLGKIGLIINPKSGQGAAHNQHIARQLVQALRADAVLTGPGSMGAEAIPSARVLAIPSLTGRAASQAVASAALQEGVDALVVVGGDGTLSDIAFAVYQTGSHCPILGVGAGSINAGDLITCKASQVDDLRDCDFRVERINALEASYNGEVKALAFNDVVISTTIVGTIDGEYRDLDANAFMESRQILSAPRPIGTESARVTKHTPSSEILIASGQSVGTVIAGFSHYEPFFGKAIIGAVGLSSLAGAPAGCLVCEQPLVSTHLDLQEHLKTEPIRSAYVSLTDDAAIRITGLDAPAVLCADGNPLAALRPPDVSQIRVRAGAVDVLRIIDTHERAAI
ncbi:MAG: NAD(+)/NADH kinase [Anaerolineae bacterium]|nr:NAD(+)/NADH kinase [Anaerolineae bacterium]